MLKALIAGERDPVMLAGLALGRLKDKRAALEQVLNGRFTDHHAFLLSRLEHVDARERPDLHFVLEAFSSLDGGAAFEAGLALLLDGIAAARTTRREKRTRRL